MSDFVHVIVVVQKITFRTYSSYIFYGIIAQIEKEVSKLAQIVITVY